MHNNKLLTVAAMLLMAASALLMQSCENKWGNEPYNPSNPQQELVTQAFDLIIGVNTKPIDVTKAWDPTVVNLDGLLKYSTVPAAFTLTGIGSSVGKNYTQDVTVAQLKAGTVTMSILPGTYNITFETPHIQSADPRSQLSGTPTTNPPAAIQMGDVLDIKVVNNNVSLTGTPIAVTATLEDFLVVVDIPAVPLVYTYNTPTGETTPVNTNLIAEVAPKNYHWGYMKASPLFLRFNPNSTGWKTVDASAYVKGNAYHMITQFGATVQITIPNMTVVDVIVP
jgi:hypothetical protein